MNTIMVRRGRLNEVVVTEDVFTKTAAKAEENRRLRLAREQWALLIAKERGLSVPNVVRYSADAEGREVLTLKRIQAKNLTFFPAHAQIEIMHRVGFDLFSKLRSVGKNKFGWPHPETLEGEYDGWGKFLEDFAGLYGARLVGQGIVSHGTIDALLGMITQFDFSAESSDLIHRDIKESNILCLADLSKYWIVDWENALLGDGLFDLATYSGNYGRNRSWEGLADGFGKDKTNSEKYMLYEAIALVGTVDFYIRQKLDCRARVKALKAVLNKLSCG